MSKLVKGYRIDNRIYIFEDEAMAIPESQIGVLPDVIYVERNLADAFKEVEANADIADLIKGYNFQTMTINAKEWAGHEDDELEPVEEPEPEPEPEPEQNSIAGTDFDENEGKFGTLTVSLENETPMTVTYVEDDLYSDFELMNALYNSELEFTNSSIYEWTKDGEPISEVAVSGDKGEIEPLVYTYNNNGEDGPMFTVEYISVEDSPTGEELYRLTPDATGVFVATLITEPEPDPEPGE